MNIYFPLIFFILLSTSISFYFQIHIFKSIVVGTFSTILVLYVFGLFGLLRFGLYVVVIILFLSFIYALLKRTKSFFEFIFKIDLIVNIAIIGLIGYFIIYINKERFFYQYDEFAHWGLMIKEMLRLDQFYSVKASNLISHKDYPPIIVLYEYLWVQIIRSYRESYVYQGLQFLGVILILPNIIHIRNKGLTRTILIIISWVLLLSLFNYEYAYFYTTIYLDAITAIIFAFLLFQIYSINPHKMNRYNILLSSSILVLTKEIGIVFLFLSLIFYLVILKQNKLLKVRNFLVYIPSLIFLFTWKIYINILNISGQFNISASNFNIISSSDFHQKFQEVTNLTVSNIFSTGLINNKLNLNFLQLILIFIIFYFILSFLHKEIKTKFISLSLLIPVFSIFYLIVLYFLYLFSFSTREALYLASWIRYASTFWASIIIFSFLVIINLISDKFFKILILSFLILIGIPKENLNQLQQDVIFDEEAYFYQVDIDNIQLNTPIDAKIYLIAQNQTPNMLDRYRYWLNTHPMNINGHSLGLPYNESDFYTINYSVDEFEYFLKDFDYIYIYLMDDQFYNNYKEIFPNYFIQKNHQLYKITFDEKNNLKLEIIV